MEQYLKSYHEEDITDILNNCDDSVIVSIKLNLTTLQSTNHILFDNILRNPHGESLKWNMSLLNAQKLLVEGNMFLEEGYKIKENCFVRFINIPKIDSRLDITFPTNDHVGKFLQIKGNVVRMTQTRLLEIKKDYICSKCKQEETIVAEYSTMYVFEVTRFCSNLNTGNCKGNIYPVQTQPKPDYCIDYQEIRVQELLSDKNIPSSIIVTLENDLADSCQPGDCITVCGTVERRWKPLHVGKKSEVIITMRAISVSREETKPQIGRDLPEQLLCVRAQWQDIIDKMGELNARDLILKSICPEIHGLYLAKLAIALSLCSGIEISNFCSRGHSHLLLVGDPGLAKSKLIKFASKIAMRSVYTTGMGCSQAGLTAAAIRDGGEWQLEAGALVLADGGICCIDEFNMMRESDKASIHEAMEQQTVSMAKAGIVCKLSTRCAILAATNHKNMQSISEYDETSCINIGIASPLMSRFDIVLILRDIRDIEWDTKVAEHILEKNEQVLCNDSILSIEDLQSHFLAVRNIHPEMTPLANELLGSYYKFCRSDLRRDPGRTTARLLDSLIRLSQSHARLLFRSKILVDDVITIIKLIETSWGFGHLLSPLDILKTELPLGPNQTDTEDIFKLLNLHYTPEQIVTNNTLNRTNENLPQINNINSFKWKNRINDILSCVSQTEKKENDELENILSMDFSTQPLLLKNKSISSTNSSPPLRSSTTLLFEKESKIMVKRCLIKKNNLENNINIEKEFRFVPKKMRKSDTAERSIEVPKVDIQNLDNIYNDIQTTFCRKSEKIFTTNPNKPSNALLLSSSQEIDLDEIFADEDCEDDVKICKTPNVLISNKTLKKLDSFKNKNEVVTENDKTVTDTPNSFDKINDSEILDEHKNTLHLRSIVFDDDDLGIMDFDL